MRSQPKPVRHGSFRPQLEVLEDRRVPACTVTFGATTLTITGDGAGNILTINDLGTGAAGSITVNCDGVTTANTVAVNSLTISIDTQGGPDSVAYNLNGDLLTGRSRTLTALLGDQNDSFQARAVEVGGMSSDLHTGSTLVLNVNGQSGRDNLVFDFSKDPGINGTAVLFISAAGGKDRDNISFNYDGSVDGTLSFSFNGNQQRDRISAYVNLDGGSAGTMSGQVNGQVDNDLLALVVNKSTAFTGTAIGQMDGGGGIDAGIAANFVTVTQVEDLFRLPL